MGLPGSPKIPEQEQETPQTPLHPQTLGAASLPPECQKKVTSCLPLLVPFQKEVLPHTSDPS